MKRPFNPKIENVFPHLQEPYDNVNWFDRHPVISGALCGVVFAAIMFLGVLL